MRAQKPANGKHAELSKRTERRILYGSLPVVLLLYLLGSFFLAAFK